MKLLRVERRKYIFQLTTPEKRVLQAVLSRYSLLPRRSQPLSKSTPEKADQRLLEEALAARRRDNQKQLQGLLKSKRRVQKAKVGWRMKLSGTDIEWMLQVLNDVRLGSWAVLGSPDLNHHLVVDDSTGPHLWAMELSGYFQMRLLEALQQGRATPKPHKKRTRKGRSGK